MHALRSYSHYTHFLRLGLHAHSLPASSVITPFPTFCLPGCSVGFQRHELGYYNSLDNLPTTPMDGNLAECVAECKTKDECVGFAREIVFSDTAVSKCYLKKAGGKLEEAKGWQMYMRRCPDTGTTNDTWKMPFVRAKMDGPSVLFMIQNTLCAATFLLQLPVHRAGNSHAAKLT